MNTGTRRVEEEPEEQKPVQASGTRRVEPQDEKSVLNASEMSDTVTRRVPADAGNRSAENTGPAGTRRVTDDGRTAAAGSPPAATRARMPLGSLAVGHVLCGDCTVLDTIKPHETQQPGIYLCDAPEGKVIVKVAATLHPPKQELWSRLEHLNHPHVLRTFRTLHVDAPNEFYYEVQEYCASGSLEERIAPPGAGREPLAPEWALSTLIPQISAGLHYLHEQEIIHRDIKPANIYIKPGPTGDILVLGDFDISSVLEQTKTSRDTQRAAGTWIYTAPEAFPRFVDDYATGRQGRITRSADYYSLGITLIEALIGTTSLHTCGLPDLFDFYLRGDRVTVPTSISDHLALLLRGLLIRNYHTRWGYAEVQRWLAGKTSEEDLQKVRDDDRYELSRASKPYALKGNPVDLPGLAEAMCLDSAIAEEDLMGGEVLLNWIGNLDARVAREVRREREKWRKQPALALFGAIMHCDPTRPFPMTQDIEAVSPREWSERAENMARAKNGRSEDLVSDPALQKLEIWLRLKAEPELSLADALPALRKSPSAGRLEEILFCFLPERAYPVAPNVYAHTPQEIVELTYGSPAEWEKGVPAVYQSAFERWKSGLLAAWMRQRGLAEVAAEDEVLRKQKKADEQVVFEELLRRLHPATPAVQIEVDTSSLGAGCVIAYGQTGRFTLPYTSRGCGIPSGQWRLDEALPGLQLESHLLSGRSGSVVFKLDSKNEIPASRPFQAKLTLESRIARLQQGALTIPYRVSLPLAATLIRVGSGAAAGAFLLGGARLLLMNLGLKGVLNPAIVNTSSLWSETTQWHFPLFSTILGFLIVGAAGCGGYYLWLHVLKKYSEA